RAKLASKVSDYELRTRAIGRHGTAEQRAPDRGIRVGDAHVVDVATELPVHRHSLALPEQVRLIESDKATESVSLTERRSEVHLPRALLFHVEDDVHVAFLVCGHHFRNRKGSLEEAHVAEALVARDEQV